MSKIDFSAIMVKSIEGQDVTLDIRVAFGNSLYMQGQDIEECELGSAIYHAKAGEEMELTDKQEKIVKSYSQRLPYITRKGIEDALSK